VRLAAARPLSACQPSPTGDVEISGRILPVTDRIAGAKVMFFFNLRVLIKD